MVDPLLAVQNISVRSGFGLVAVLDALGTKGILATASAQDVFQRWQIVTQLVKTTAERINDNLPDCCTPILLSDTIILSMLPPEESRLTEVVQTMGGALQGILFSAIVAGVYLRGAVSAGNIHRTDSRILGTAIEEAAEWYETTDWIGVVATPTLGMLLQLYKLKGHDPGELFVQAEVPFKTGSKPESWCVNWTGYGKIQAPELALTVLDSFIKNGAAIPPAVAPKYSNTLNFVTRKRA